MYKKILLGALLSVSTLGAALASPVSALTFSSSVTNSTSFDSTRGYSFSVTQAGLSATHLGVFDAGGNGLNERHEVGLWATSGTLLASVFVPAGTVATLTDGFRYVDIPDVAIPIGDYVVGAAYVARSGDDQAIDLVGLTMAPGLSYGQTRFINGVTALTLPTSTLVSGRTGLPGGTLMVDTISAPVPEPAPLALLAAALTGLGLSRRRRA